MKRIILLLVFIFTIATLNILASDSSQKLEAKALEQRLAHYHKIRSELTKAQREYASEIKDWQEYCNSRGKSIQIGGLADPECTDRPRSQAPQASAPPVPEVPKPQPPSTEQK